MRSFFLLCAVSVAAACVQLPAPDAFSSSETTTKDDGVGRLVEVSATVWGKASCPPGELAFLVPWEHSPAYDPALRFVRAPDPVPVCVAVLQAQVRALEGGAATLLKFPAGGYRLKTD